MHTFVPVILGSDCNVYGVAASFHAAYGVKSVACGVTHQFFTEHLDFLKVCAFKDFENPKTFVRVLNALARRPEMAGKDLLLVPCSDGYAGLVIENQKRLDKAYRINTITPDLRRRLENKKDFYATCEAHALPYPDTFLITKDNFEDFTLPFDYPVIAKPNDSIKYFHITFDGYKKAYKVESAEALKEILRKVYAAGYDDAFIIQDFIPGGTDAMFVVNAYVDHTGCVRMTCGAQCALDECLPNDIGNYNALITGSYEKLTDSVKNFLEAISYRGFANFDFKYDRRDDTYKVFEINLRQGRSSYYMTVSGNNFVTYLVDDLIYNTPKPYVNFTDAHLWYYVAKSVLKTYAPESLKGKVHALLKSGNATFSMSYNPRHNPLRIAYGLRRQLSTIKYYPVYEKERQED